MLASNGDTAEIPAVKCASREWHSKAGTRKCALESVFSKTGTLELAHQIWHSRVGTLELALQSWNGSGIIVRFQSFGMELEWNLGKGHRKPFLNGMEWEQNGLVAHVIVLIFEPYGSGAELARCQTNNELIYTQVIWQQSKSDNNYDHTPSISEFQKVTSVACLLVQ